MLDFENIKETYRLIEKRKNAEEAYLKVASDQSKLDIDGVPVPASIAEQTRAMVLTSLDSYLDTLDMRLKALGITVPPRAIDPRSDAYPKEDSCHCDCCDEQIDSEEGGPQFFDTDSSIGDDVERAIKALTKHPEAAFSAVFIDDEPATVIYTPKGPQLMTINEIADYLEDLDRIFSPAINKLRAEADH